MHRLVSGPTCALSPPTPNQRRMRGEKIMPSTQNAVNNHEYRSVPITALAESATNPRKRFDAKSLLGNRSLFARPVGEHRSFHNVESCLGSRPPTWPRPRNEEFWKRHFAPCAVSTLECIPESRCFVTSLCHSGSPTSTISSDRPTDAGFRTITLLLLARN